MSGQFVIKKRIVGAGPSIEYAVHENLGLCAGLSWRPWFVSYDEEKAKEYQQQATEITQRYGRFELDGPYWCEVSPRSGLFGPQFNIYQSDGWFGLDKKLVHSVYKKECAEAWASRATKLLKSA